MIIAEIAGQKMEFRSEASLVAYSQAVVKVTAMRSESCPRVRRQRKRESALRVYFKMIQRGGDQWPRVAAIHTKAPKLTERIAKECGIPDLGGYLPNDTDEALKTTED